LKTFNVSFTDSTSLIDFIHINNIKNYKNILVQIFSGIIDENIVLDISDLIHTKLPQAHIIGTTTAGEILNGKMYDGTILVSFSCFNTTQIKSKLFDLNKPFHIDLISKHLIQDNTKALIIFSDGLKSNAEELLKNLTLSNPNILIAGGRAADPIEFKKTFVFDKDSTTENGIVIASLNGDELIVNSDYILNWNQIGKEMIVTKSKGNIVYEIDGVKIKDLYRKYLGDDIADNLPSAGTEFPLITVRNGVEIARAPIAVLEDGALLFGGNLNVGEKVRFAYGNINDIKNSIYQHNLKLSKLPIEAIFIYSCSGRKTLMGKELEAEFKMLNSLAPTAGFFTYGEYFHSSHINEILNITTTFITLSENKNIKSNNIYASNEYYDNRILKALTHLANVTTKEVEYQNKELSRLSNMISNIVLYTTADLKGNILTISKAYLRFLNQKEEDIIGKNHNIFRHPDTPNSFYKKMWSTLNQDKRFIGEIKNKRKDGSEYWIQITIDPMFDEKGIKIGYSSYREDITDKKLLEHMSSHDPLTGLYNRGEFSKKIKEKIEWAQENNTTFGFTIFDIDHFKNINDTFGHQVGDEVLIKISNELLKVINEEDFLARWGGEEFVLITNHSNIKDLEKLIKKIQQTISKVSFSPVPKVTMSFGLTLYKPNDTKDSLLKRADTALYQAKENGRNRYEINL